MIKNTSWESLVWIVIWVFILSFIVLWITNLLINSKTIVDVYNNKKTISILKNNTENIVKKIDTQAVLETEIFYLYKDNTFKEFQVFTWSTNYIYKYIDKYWNKVDDLENFEWDIYSRILWLERDDTSLWDSHQIIKASIKKLIKK
jgi:ABC-type microcin C transport system permease subunit YejE